MSVYDIAGREPDFAFFDEQLVGWSVGSTPSDRGYVVEIKPGFSNEIRVPLMQDLRVELLDPTPLNGTDISVSDAPGRPGGIRTISGRPHENFPIELIGGEVIQVDHPLGAIEQGPAFFKATILGTRLTADLLNLVNRGPDTVTHSLGAFAKKVAMDPDMPVERIDFEDGSFVFRGNPAQVASAIERSPSGRSKMSLMLDALAKLQASTECDIEDTSNDKKGV